MTTAALIKQLDILGTTWNYRRLFNSRPVKVKIIGRQFSHLQDDGWIQFQLSPKDPIAPNGIWTSEWLSAQAYIRSDHMSLCTEAEWQNNGATSSETSKLTFVQQFILLHDMAKESSKMALKDAGAVSMATTDRQKLTDWLKENAHNLAEELKQ